MKKDNELANRWRNMSIGEKTATVLVCGGLICAIAAFLYLAFIVILAFSLAKK